MNNILIVENKNDKIFIQSLIELMNIENIEVEKIQIDEENYKFYNLEPNPKKPTALIKKLKDIKTEILKKGIQRIGILLDIDNSTIDNRLLLINNALEKVFEKNNFEKIKNINQPTEIQIDDDNLVQVLCYFTNVNGKGELETVMRKIACKNAKYADCLNAWRECLERKGEKISDKDFDKFWVANYIRFDTCSKNDKKHANKKCNMSAFSYVMQNKKDIFDFSHDVLKGMRDFLKLFKS